MGYVIVCLYPYKTNNPSLQETGVWEEELVRGMGKPIIKEMNTHARWQTMNVAQADMDAWQPWTSVRCLSSN